MFLLLSFQNNPGIYDNNNNNGYKNNINNNNCYNCNSYSLKKLSFDDHVTRVKKVLKFTKNPEVAQILIMIYLLIIMIYLLITI